MQANNLIYFLCPQCGSRVAEASVAAKRYFCRVSCRRSFEKNPDAGSMIRLYEESLWSVHRVARISQIISAYRMSDNKKEGLENHFLQAESHVKRLKENVDITQRLLDLQKQMGISDRPKATTLDLHQPSRYKGQPVALGLSDIPICFCKSNNR